MALCSPWCFPRRPDLPALLCPHLVPVVLSLPHARLERCYLIGSSSPRCCYRDQSRVRTEPYPSVRKDRHSMALHRGPSTGASLRRMTKITLCVRMPLPSGPDCLCSFVQRETQTGRPEKGGDRQRQWRLLGGGREIKTKSLRAGTTHRDCKKGKARHQRAQDRVDSTCDSEREQGRGETWKAVGTECGR